MHTHTCPICHDPLRPDKNGDSPHTPFCSERCRMIDLGSWLSGHYAIPTSEPIDIDPEELNQPPNPQ